MADKRYIDYGAGSTANDQLILTADPVTSVLGKTTLIFIGLEYAINNNNALTADRAINLATHKLTFSNGRLAASSYGSGTITGTPTKNLAVDSSGNIIEVDLSAAAVTADNGLTISSGTNVQLGATNSTDSPLLHATYINTSGANVLNIQGSRNGFLSIFNITQTGNGISVRAENNSASYPAIMGYNPNAGPVFSAYTEGGGYAYYGNISNSVNNSVVTAISLLRTSTATPPAAVGIGLSIEFGIENAGSGSAVANTIVSKFTTVTAGAEVSQLIITGIDGGTGSDLLTINGNGQLKFNKYGSGTFTGTAAKWLAVTSAGLMIEESAPGGSITASNGLRMSTATNVVIGNTSGPGTALANDTFIDAGAFVWTINTSNTNGSVYTLSIQNSGGGGTLGATNSGGGNTAGFTNSGIGDALQLNVTSGYGITVNATTGKAGRMTLNPSSINTCIPILELNRTSSSGSAPTAGIGCSIDFYVKTDLPGLELTHRIKSTWSNATTGSRVSALIIAGVDAGATQDLLTVKGSGQMQFHKYGSGTFTGTEAKKLAVDSSGNVIEVAP